MEIPFEGEITRDIVSAAIKLDGTTFQRISGWVFLKALAIIVALSIVFLGTEKVKFCAFLLISVFLIDIWSLFKRKSDSIKEMYNCPSKPMKGIVSKQQFEFFDKASHSKIEWSYLKSHKINDNLAILYVNKSGYWPFHQSWFQSDADWNCFLKLVKENTSEKKE